MHHRKLLLIAMLASISLLAAFPANARDPWVDTSFTPVTPAPDVDLVVVRERAFQSVDLSPLGLGVEDYVQSIYFRLHKGPTGGPASAAGIVIFPDGVDVLGFLTLGDDLGGSEDDRAATRADALFGIDVDPDQYSVIARGFERGGVVASSEFVLSDGDRSFAFVLNITGGVDDFRVLIDYGSSFPPDLSFDLVPYEIGEIGGALPSPGIQVGDPESSVVGSGDFGEIGSLLNIPLTSYDEPEAVTP